MYPVATLSCGQISKGSVYFFCQLRQSQQPRKATLRVQESVHVKRILKNLPMDRNARIYHHTTHTHTHTHVHTILMEEGDSLVELPGIGNDVFSLFSKHCLLYDRWIVVLPALDGQLPHSLLQFEVAGWDGLLKKLRF